MYLFATIYISSLRNAFSMPSLSPRHGVVIVWEHYFPEASLHIIVPKHHRLSGLIVGMVQAFGLRGV